MYFAISIFAIMEKITSVNDDILLVFSEWWRHMGSSLVFMHFEDRHAVVCSVVHILPYLFWGRVIRVVPHRLTKLSPSYFPCHCVFLTAWNLREYIRSVIKWRFISSRFLFLGTLRIFRAVLRHTKLSLMHWGYQEPLRNIKLQHTKPQYSQDTWHRDKRGFDLVPNFLRYTARTYLQLPLR